MRCHRIEKPAPGHSKNQVLCSQRAGSMRIEVWETMRSIYKLKPRRSI